jgi:hypothetical protein
MDVVRTGSEACMAGALKAENQMMTPVAARSFKSKRQSLGKTGIARWVRSRSLVQHMPSVPAS